ncbi:PREDICTED: uncharacterized protein LOC108548192 [Eufriesea mexicana]|uniref:uncharacterized protein LOC108548192 n=1 Tax=Eufriesea mexicana TaxID=516756 RepID=UPI00083C4501|nr:PREDICTED: uncharacterized protein LOC108548192 [Eufriesea mexicana]
MAPYGAPAWADDLMARRRSGHKLASVARRLYIRMVRVYRTISHEAAIVPAGLPHFDLDAAGEARVNELLRRDGGLPAEEAHALRRQVRLSVLAKWRERLLQERSMSRRAVGAVLSILWDWVRNGGRLTYRLTQVLIGHGCFGEHLCRIGRKATAQCHHCGAELDTAQHTLEECLAWAAKRRILFQSFGRDLLLYVVMPQMPRCEGTWRDMASFCEQVTLQKEAAERTRERADSARIRRHWRRSRRRLAALPAVPVVF